MGAGNLHKQPGSTEAGQRAVFPYRGHREGVSSHVETASWRERGPNDEGGGFQWIAAKPPVALRKKKKQKKKQKKWKNTWLRYLHIVGRAMHLSRLPRDKYTTVYPPSP